MRDDIDKRARNHALAEIASDEGISLAYAEQKFGAKLTDDDIDAWRPYARRRVEAIKEARRRAVEP